MLATIHSAAVNGLAAQPITVEVDISPGFPSFTIVGLPDAAIQESKERIRSAIKHFGVSFPDIKVVVNLAPADVRKAGPSYDLPIALAILAAAGHVPLEALQSAMCVGEVSLNGELRPIHGALAMAQLAKQEQRDFVVPGTNAIEAALVPGVKIYAADTVKSVVDHLRQETTLPLQPHEPPKPVPPDAAYDFAFIKGHQAVKRVMEVAAAGAHHMLLYGPPGSGKTILARTLLSIMPELSIDEVLELTTLYSVAGLLNQSDGYIKERPLRSPHHSASTAALVGGGRLPRPGEISLAHHGILYLDELPEFSRATIEALRQPLEEHVITVSRVETTITYPARSMFIGSLNPCPCGYYGDDQRECSCTPQQISQYQKKLSGPLLDRMDMFCYVPRVTFDALTSTHSQESSAVIRQRVIAARNIQTKRLQGVATQTGQAVTTNAHIPGQVVEQYCEVSDQAKPLLKQAMHTMQLSPRSYHRILRVARTIADLGQSEHIESDHIAEALQYRQSSFVQA